jgi:6-oxo-cyclohex-1-ene-carbonyl-CoA hydrolase
MLRNHHLADIPFNGVGYELKPCLDPKGKETGLFHAWIILKNPLQLNSYTTEMVKEVILGFRKASCARDVVCVVFTGEGNRAFCTGGNVKEYAEYYAGRPDEYRQYMRLFNDMVSAILHCDKPVICRVNGMRIGGGQEIGMACDFSVSSDMALFGQAGPKHGSAPDGGSTDFLPLFVGMERAMMSCTLCETWTAHKAYSYGLLTEIAPVLKKEGEFLPNPLAITDRWLDPKTGKIIYGDLVGGAEKEKAKALIQSCTIDFSLLDQAVERLCTSLLMTMPTCLTKTIESLRKHKLEHWDRNRETNRSWLGLNMMTEAKAGFRAFNEGSKENREVDFIQLRRLLADGHLWDETLFQAISPSKKN